MDVVGLLRLHAERRHAAGVGGLEGAGGLVAKLDDRALDGIAVHVVDDDVVRAAVMSVTMTSAKSVLMSLCIWMRSACSSSLKLSKFSAIRVRNSLSRA